jgi:uncharacterized protein
MKKILSAALAGMIFGTGIALSGMGNPAKVMNFFDVAGTFDPSLIFVMGGGLIVALVGYRLIFATRGQPLFEPRFSLPTARLIDRELVGGSALFGIGWGITGFCPGGAIPVLGLGVSSVYVFMASMIAGMLVAMAIKLRMGKSKFG